MDGSIGIDQYYFETENLTPEQENIINSICESAIFFNSDIIRKAFKNLF
jgi:hypothetical protein